MQRTLVPLIAIMICAQGFGIIHSHAQKPSPLDIQTGWKIPSEGYCDQPYVVKVRGGAWLCAMTTGTGKEGGRGQHIVATRTNLTALSDGSLFRTYRTVAGHPCQTYSRDGGKTWTPPEFMSYYPGGPLVDHPRAANFVRRLTVGPYAGRYLYWFHNHKGKSYEGRNPAYLMGGVEQHSPQGMVIHWGEPVATLFANDPLVRISYPDFIWDHGHLYITETQKTTARVHELPATLLNSLWATPIMTSGKPAAKAQRLWFEHAVVGMEVGPTGAQFGYSDNRDTRYCAFFDGREIVQRCAAAHSEYLVLWARDGDYAYYNSKILPKAAGLGERDPLREAVDEARKHRLPVLAYCVVQQGGHYLQTHPEFEMRGIDGKRLGRFCYNSGYLDAMKQIVAEQLAYGIAGFHIDMLDQGFGSPYGCWCDHCQRLFAGEFGHKMPAVINWDAGWEEMLSFRYRTSERFEKALREYIRSVDPRATVDFNYHGNPPFSWEVGQRPVQHAGNGDFVTGETGQWGFSALGVGMNAEFYRASTPGRPYQVAIQRGVRMYHDQTTRPLADIRWELFTLLAHNAFVTMVDKTGFDGHLDPVAYDRIGAAFQEARDKRADFGQRPMYEVGLYFSARSRDWTGRQSPSNYFQSFQGAYKACIYSHIMCGVLFDESVTPEKLKEFPVVCLPGATILSEREVRLFANYVQAGGKLLVTGQSGLFDSLGKPLSSSSLEALIGAKAARRLETLDNWVNLDSRSTASLPALANSIPQDWNFLVRGPATVYEPGAAIPIGKLLQPHRTIRQNEGKETTDWPMSADSQVGPALLVHPMGRGTVLTFACSPDFATASDHHITEARNLLRNAIRLVHANPRVQITAPTNVETVVTDDPDARTLRIHFLAYNSLPQTTPATGRPYILPGLIEEAPLFKASIHIDKPIASGKAWNKSTQVKISGSVAEVTINDIHEVLRLKY